MIYVKVVEQNKETPGWKEVPIEDLNDTGIMMARVACKIMLDELEDAHRKLMDEGGEE